MRKIIRITVGVFVIAIAYGACFLIDAQPTRHTPWPRYLVLALASGLFLFAIEGGSELVAGRDRTTDPTYLPATRLLALLGLVAIAFRVLWSVAHRM